MCHKTIRQLTMDLKFGGLNVRWRARDLIDFAQLSG